MCATAAQRAARIATRTLIRVNSRDHDKLKIWWNLKRGSWPWLCEKLTSTLTELGKPCAWPTANQSVAREQAESCSEQPQATCTHRKHRCCSVNVSLAPAGRVLANNPILKKQEKIVYKCAMEKRQQTIGWRRRGKGITPADKKKWSRAQAC